MHILPYFPILCSQYILEGARFLEKIYSFSPTQFFFLESAFGNIFFLTFLAFTLFVFIFISTVVFFFFFFVYACDFYIFYYLLINSQDIFLNVLPIRVFISLM